MVLKPLFIYILNVLCSESFVAQICFQKLLDYTKFTWRWFDFWFICHVMWIIKGGTSIEIMDNGCCCSIVIRAALECLCHLSLIIVVNKKLFNSFDWIDIFLFVVIYSSHNFKCFFFCVEATLIAIQCHKHTVQLWLHRGNENHRIGKFLTFQDDSKSLYSINGANITNDMHNIRQQSLITRNRSGFW